MPDVPEKLTTGEPLSIEELLQYFPALKEVPATLLKQYAVGAATRRIFPAGEIVCREGEFGSTAFYVVRGHVEIYLANPLAHVRTKPRGWGITSLMKRMTSALVSGGEERDPVGELGFIPIDASVDLPRLTPLAYLGPGELFGEMTCRTFQPRSATVRATEDCVLVEMLRVVLDMLLGTRDPDALTKATTKVRAPTFKGTSFKKAMDDTYRHRSLVAHLRSVPLFATLDLEFFNYLQEHAELVSCNKGEVICRQGDEADAFYLIRTGLVRVSQEMPGGEVVRTYLKKGEYFGEIGLMRAQQRVATCSALDAVDLVKIGKEDFALMMEKFPVIRSTLDRVVLSRLEALQDRTLPTGMQLDEFLSQGLFEAQNLLLIDLDHCTRCDACVNACADAHDGVSRLIRDGLRYDHYLVATACRSCRDPLCMTQCPVGSIRRKSSLEIIIEDWCIGCSKCAELCPYGNINMHSFEVKKEVPATDPKAAAKPAAGAAAAKPASAPAAKAPAPAAKPAAEKPSVPPNEVASISPAIPVLPAKDPAMPAAEVARDSSPPAPQAAFAAAAGEKPAASLPAPGTSPSTAPAPDAAKASGPATPAVVPAPAPKPAPATASAPAAKPAAAAPAKAAGPVKMVKKKVTVSKATTCDLCTQLSVPSCVYACPHEAAMRVEPTRFLATQIGRKGSRVQREPGALRRGTIDRTTH